MTSAGTDNLTALLESETVRFHPDEKSFVESVSPLLVNRVVSYLDNEELTDRGLQRAIKYADIDSIVKVTLLSQREAVVLGWVSAVEVVNVKIKQLKARADRLVSEAQMCADGFSVLSNRRVAAEVLESVKHLEASLQRLTVYPLAGSVVQRCLVWSGVIEVQPLPVRDALADLDIDGLYCVKGQQFFSRKLAHAYLEVLSERCEQSEVALAGELYGYTIFEYLRGKYGNKLPAILCQHGVFGIVYSDGYTSFLR